MNTHPWSCRRINVDTRSAFKSQHAVARTRCRTDPIRDQPNLVSLVFPFSSTVNPISPPSQSAQFLLWPARPDFLIRATRISASLQPMRGQLLRRPPTSAETLQHRGRQPQATQPRTAQRSPIGSPSCVGRQGCILRRAHAAVTWATWACPWVGW